MTTQEIKDLIMSKIAGQGSAVDAGSALPQILNAIVDAIGEGGGGSGKRILETGPNANWDSFGKNYNTALSRAQLAEILDISETDVDRLIDLEFTNINFALPDEPYCVAVSQAYSDGGDAIYLNFADCLSLTVARMGRVVNQTTQPPVDFSTTNCWKITRNRNNEYRFYNIWVEYGLVPIPD